MLPDHHHHLRPWRKPLSYFLNHLFNLDPFRDFGILDEVVGIILVIVTIALSIYTSRGAEPQSIPFKTFDCSDTDRVQGVTCIASTEKIELKSGDGWVKGSTLSSDTINDLVIRGSQGAAVGAGGTIHGWNGTSFYRDPFASANTAEDLHGADALSNGDIWVVGSAGTIYRRSNGTWEPVNFQGVTADLNGVRAISATDVWIVGAGGKILRWTGANVTDLSPNASTTWNDIDCSSGTCWAVGGGGAIATCTASSCNISTPGSSTLNRIAVVDGNTVFVAGNTGKILHGPGSWEEMSAGSANLHGIAMLSATKGWAVGEQGAIYAFNGTAWTAATSPYPSSTLYTVDTTSSGAWAAGANGVFTRWGAGTIYDDTGTYTSPTLDLKTALKNGKIGWTATVPSGTTLRFQVASSDNSANTTWNFYGPDGPTTEQNFVETFYDSSGGLLHTSHTGHRYVRFKAYLATTNAASSPLLDTVTFTTDVETLDVPTLKRPDNNDVMNSQPTFEWNTVTGADRYELQIAKNLAFTEDAVTLSKESTTGVVDTSLIDDKYYWRVRATKGTENDIVSQWSGTRSFTLDTLPPAAPALTVPSKDAALDAMPSKFQWSDVTGAATYSFALDRNNGFGSPIASGAALTKSEYAVGTVLTSGTYYWRARSHDAIGNASDWTVSSFSIKENTTPPPPTEPPPQPSGPGSGGGSTPPVDNPPPAPPVEPLPPPVEPPPVEPPLPSISTPPQEPPQSQAVSEQSAPARVVSAVAETVKETTKKAVQAVTQAAKKTAETTKKVIKENEREVKISLSVAVPVATVANPTVVATFPNIHTLLYHFVSWVLSLFGIRKKRKPWGVVYDAISKEPIALAIVRLLKDKKLIETQVTDGEGRFGFLAPTGSYALEVTKPDFLYPSKLVTAPDDDEYPHSHLGDTITVREGEIVNMNIPIDPRDPKKEKQKGALWYTVKHVLKKLALPILAAGTLLSWLTALVVASPFNVTVFIIYLFFLVYEIIFSPRAPRPWGTIFDATSADPVSLAAVSLVETKFNRVLKSRLSDYSGRFTFFPPAGEYKVIVKKQGYQFPASDAAHTHGYHHPYFGDPVTVKKDKAVINMNIPVQRKA